MYYYNIYEKPNGEIILKRLKNRNAYENWNLIDTYIEYDNQFLKFEEFRKIIKKPQLDSSFKKIIKYFKEL